VDEEKATRGRRGRKGRKGRAAVGKEFVAIVLTTTKSSTVSCATSADMSTRFEIIDSRARSESMRANPTRLS
jgi:hypothetical protein